MSILLEYEDYERSCKVIDSMDDGQLDEAEVAFLKAVNRKKAVMNQAFVGDPALKLKLGKLAEKWNKRMKVTNVASFGRNVLKNFINK